MEKGGSKVTSRGTKKSRQREAAEGAPRSKSATVNLRAFSGDGCSVVLHPALKSYLTYRFYKTALKLRGEVNEALVEFGLIGVQLGILRVLSDGGPASQVELGRGLGIDKASMVKLIDAIEARGYVERRAGERDRREKRVVLTRAGEKVIDRAAAARKKVEERFLSPLTKGEREQLETILSKLVS